MKKIVWYIVIVFFFCLGCEVQAQEKSPHPIITDIRPYVPAKPDVNPTVVLDKVALETPTTKPVIKEAIFARPESSTEEVDEDEQIKQILIEKAKKIYNENRDNIRLFLIRWVCNVFYVILALYWLLKLFNWIFGNRAGFIILWLILLIACLTCVMVFV